MVARRPCVYNMSWCGTLTTVFRLPHSRTPADWAAMYQSDYIDERRVPVIEHGHLYCCIECAHTKE